MYMVEGVSSRSVVSGYCFQHSFSLAMEERGKGRGGIRWNGGRRKEGGQAGRAGREQAWEGYL